MSVQRFLTNIDVVYAVFGHLDLFPRPITSDLNSLAFRHGNDPTVARRTLANAALTCRAFAEPASKTLWTCLHQGLLPLLLKTFSCLEPKNPLSLGFATKGMIEYQYYVLDGDISAAEWDNFDRLASWVRYIDFPYVAFHPSVMDALIKHCQSKGEALLPNLRVLRWRESVGDMYDPQLLRALCLAPSLSFVSISTYDKYEFMAQDLATIAETRPDLAHFSSTGSLCLHFDNPLLSMRSLKSLRVAAVDDASLYQIGTLPYLTDLSINVRDTGSLHMNAACTPSQGDPTFTTLRRLATSGTPATLIWMITQISSPILTSLSAGSYGKLADILPMFETLFALPAVQSLQQLHLLITITRTDRSDEPMEIAFADLAHSILPLRRLEDVRLSSSSPRTLLSDADIVLIKSAWPRLRRLSLSFNAHRPIQDAREPILRPSLLALVDLALARPQLETLDVEVASVTEDDLLQLESISTHALGFEHPTAFRLTWLTFARSSHYRKRIGFPADIPRLARALHRLFPLVGGSRDGWTDYYMSSLFDMEDDVFRLLDELEKLKSQESTSVPLLSTGQG
ncbi:hypothetical protein C8Q74DRAFT_192283 [Fomes fomentarius]|nr:hypothetical protein C8Q74DRAFT_192283 [Fomes fomentarius]